MIRSHIQSQQTSQHQRCARARYLLRARTRPQQQTHRPPLLLSIDGTDRRTDRRTLGRFMALTAYYADRVMTGPV